MRQFTFYGGMYSPISPIRRNPAADPAPPCASAPFTPSCRGEVFSYTLRPLRAVSSAVEHCLHTARVAGSNPAPPTRFDRNRRKPVFCYAAIALQPSTIARRPNAPSLPLQRLPTGLPGSERDMSFFVSANLKRWFAIATRRRGNSCLVACNSCTASYAALTPPGLACGLPTHEDSPSHGRRSTFGPDRR